jgi:hypothetical protein
MLRISQMFVATTLAACIALPNIGNTKPRRVQCNLEGVAFEVLGCLHNDNVDYWEKLNRHYAKHLDAIFAKCQRDNPGGGSGGFEDRINCASKTLEEEAKRVNMR